MLNYFLIAAQIIVFIIIGIFVWQICRKLKTIPEDEIVGETRAKYMTQRLKWIAFCAGLEAALAVTSAVLRIFEII